LLKFRLRLKIRLRLSFRLRLGLRLNFRLGLGLSLTFRLRLCRNSSVILVGLNKSIRYSNSKIGSYVFDAELLSIRLLINAF